MGSIIMSAKPQKTSKKELKMEDQLKSLSDANKMVRDLFVNGLQNVSRMSLDQISAISMNAHNQKFMRLEAEINIIKEYLDQYLSKDPNFVIGRFVYQVNQAWALIKVLVQHVKNKDVPIDPKRILGSKTREYVYLPDVILVPLGMQLWESTDKNMVGATVYMYDVEHVTEQDIYTVANARPRMYLRGAIQNLPTNVQGEYSISTLSRSPYKFKDGKVSQALTLSSENGGVKISLSKDLVIEPVDAMYRNDHTYESWHFDHIRVHDWEHLASKLGRQQVSPFASGFSRSESYILRYTKVVASRLDDVMNVYFFRLIDDADNELLVKIENRNFNNTIIRNLQSLAQRNGGDMFANVYVSGTTLYCTPISILHGTTMVNLTM